MEQDVNILSNHSRVHCVAYSDREFIREILKPILAHSFDLVYLWFVYHYALPVSAACRAARIPCILIPSGVDIANNPEIEYGEMRFKKARMRAIASLRLSTLVLPVSKFVEDLVLRVTHPKRIRVIYNGIDTGKFKPRGIKENIILTVAGIFEGNLLYKRLDVFLKAARYLPHYSFVLVGEHMDASVETLKAMAPSNVEFPGRLSDEDLIRLYQRARVYVQVSHEEAFGCALAEAMACECVPVVVRRGALPEVAGDAGFYAPYGDPAGTAKTISRAFTNGDGSIARTRVEKMFTARQRESALIEALNSLYGQ